MYFYAPSFPIYLTIVEDSEKTSAHLCMHMAARIIRPISFPARNPAAIPTPSKTEWMHNPRNAPWEAAL